MESLWPHKITLTPSFCKFIFNLNDPVRNESRGDIAKLNVARRPNCDIAKGSQEGRKVKMLHFV